MLDHGGQPLLELLFDATDLGQAPGFLGYIPHKQGSGLLDFIRGTKFAQSVDEVARRDEWSKTVVKTLLALSSASSPPSELAP